MRYPIRHYGDPVLRAQAEPVVEVTDEVRTLADDMLETMHAERGVGLAAQQIGKALAICVVWIPSEYDVDEEGARLNPDVEMPLILINPVITARSEEVEKGEEGCLSFPEIVAPILRSKSISVKFMDRHGVAQRLDLQAFLARAVQHEVDHLNGVLFVDHMSQVKRMALAGRLKRLRKETQQKLDLA